MFKRYVHNIRHRFLIFVHVPAFECFYSWSFLTWKLPVYNYYSKMVPNSFIRNKFKNWCWKMEIQKSILGGSRADLRPKSGARLVSMDKGQATQEEGGGKGNPSQRDWNQSMPLNHLSPESCWDLWLMAPLWHHGTIAPRAPKKNKKRMLGNAQK